ncbi:efflux RND transporter periplasmic adaptor subunit [uncultured Phenylobacterium sp.]|uniref:efflux RND transporter periplasmic adaptor subunit n=1 Tax=uncultured Phenylobacterium sp. TaxID=349273 RepID=UPI0025F664BC|nr:efflux RND transporter periplasmic adaptor subunit [uncultured Phenylobacterium sp.]
MDRVDPDQARDDVVSAEASGTPAGQDDPATVTALLGEAARPRWIRPAMLGAVIVVLLLSLALLAPIALRHLQPVAAKYETAAIRRADLTVLVTVTGALAPVNQVDVGSELSGTIASVRVQENDRVAKGQVMATLDTDRLQDQVVQTQAGVAAAEAGLAQAAATRGEMRLKADRLNRLFTISSGGWPAKADVDAADAALTRARAAEAAARAAITQAQASLRTARTSLSKAAIRSPVDGVVLIRKAEPGQTVAASLQAPVLFTLAEDMRRMELHADIDEADVAQVHEGQEAVFTVDAHPGRQYRARVTRVGFGAQTKEGVVTYTGVLSLDNADLSLRPGMTASADIRSVTRRDVLLVPEAALRFTPPRSGDSQGALSRALVPRMPRLGSPPVRRSSDASRQQVWVLEGDRPKALSVHVGASDTRETEVTGSGIRAGLPVIVGAVEAPS